MNLHKVIQDDGSLKKDLFYTSELLVVCQVIISRRVRYLGIRDERLLTMRHINTASSFQDLGPNSTVHKVFPCDVSAPWFLIKLRVLLPKTLATVINRLVFYHDIRKVGKLDMQPLHVVPRKKRRIYILHHNRTIFPSCYPPKLAR